MDSQEEPTIGVLEVKRADSEPTWSQLRAKEVLRVGRGEENELVLDDFLVSRLHAVFNGSATGIILSDLSSLNGTYVNGRCVTTSVVLRPGDVVALGATEIIVHSGTTGKPPAVGTGPGTLIQQMRQVVMSILVAKVCDFTAYSEQRAPNDMAAMLQRWFARVSETVEEFGGEVDKYNGDCVMALWPGLETHARDLASQAAEAALAILVRTSALSASGVWAYHATNPWRCHIALNSGVALLRTLGGARARDFTVLGETVNVAFRLNELAGKVEPKILIGAATASLIENDFVIEPLGSSLVAGRAGAVDSFSLVRRKGAAAE